MGAIKLELKLRSPNNISGITITMDPKPDWSLSELVSELNSLELKYNNASSSSSSSSKQPLFAKTQAREFSSKKEFCSSSSSRRRSSKPFVMHISDNEESDNDDEENQDPNFVVGTRFACENLYLSDSDSSEDELAIEETQASNLMEPMGLLEGLLSQEETENQKLVQENIRHQIDLLEMDLINENERSTSALTQLEKLTEARREMARKLDTQYRRKIAEALDNHLNTIQRNHEQKSQLEERKLRNDAANEEAKRKERERIFQEEKARQEKAKKEAEAVKSKAEKAQKDALEAARRTKEAAEKKASETATMFSGEAFGSITRGTAEVSNERKGTGIKIRASERALIIEKEREQKFNELVEKNRAIKSTKDFRQYELQIGRHIRQIAGTREIIRTKANELMKILNDPLCPQSISIAMFAKKVVSNCESSAANFDGTVFACGQVIVHVTSKAPFAMDLLLAEFHKACILTVPKYVIKSESGLNDKTYLKMMGYREEDGKLESQDEFLGRLEAYMKLYGALVQTEINGVRNLHGLEEGWAWLARLLNFLPANIYTAVALEAFIKMAGFALFRRYKSQFTKILDVISQHFVSALEARGDSKLNPIIMKLKFYLDTNQHREEPEGWRIETSLLSDIVESEPRPGYYRY
ncbi:hypothetical protein AQUCO_00100165v1 [Aquilegia coerulea]|uniref:mRNA export factor GLE1 n=1 Tax=Aquilegia coerulea TaxID=218851 RepID=A0A2G5F916_AQUCA|nr:hypothetical protein AQUCO_00100165v1 [Aquilegia coerulea]